MFKLGDVENSFFGCCNDIHLTFADGGSSDIDVTELLILSKMIEENKEILIINSSFSNVCVWLKIVLIVTASAVSSKQSFPKWKLIKTYLHSSISQDRLNDLGLLSIENGILSYINIDNVITDFN